MTTPTAWPASAADLVAEHPESLLAYVVEAVASCA